MSTITNPFFPISFRRGGPNDEYGIWFYLAIKHRDLLVDPEMLCRCLDYSEPINGFTANYFNTPESRRDYFELFIPARDDDNTSLPSVMGRFDWNEHKLILDMDAWDDDGYYDVDYCFDQLSVFTKGEDCIAALYNRFVILGEGTAYGDRLTLGKMGQIMKTMLSRAHPCCRETSVPMVQALDFSFSFCETDVKSRYTSGKQLQARIGIGGRSHVFNVNRESFNFKQLRHDLENFIYHGEVRLEIIDEEGLRYVVINAERRKVLDETIPLTAGSNNRFAQLLFVTIDDCELDEKETKVIGFCDMLSSLKSIYDALSDAVYYYSKHNDEKNEYDMDVWQEDFLSKDFVSYLQSEKKKLADETARMRKHYAYAGIRTDDPVLGFFRNPEHGPNIISEAGEGEK